MNPDEHALTYPFADRLPLPGSLLPVAPGLFWLRMPLPFALDHINLWLLRDHFDGRDGWTLIDCGVATPAVSALWDTVLADCLDGLPIVRVIATHAHPDHIGMAARLTSRFRAPLWMSPGEYLFSRALGLASVDDSERSLVAHFESHGAPQSWLAERRRSTGLQRYRELVQPVPNQFVRVFDRQIVPIGARRWQVIFGYGHSPEHVALWSADDGLLIAGDMVLPRISTNVSVFDLEPLANPVRWYLDSLQRFAPLPADTLVLPSHGRPFRGLHRRIEQLTAHHDDRLAAVLEALQETSMTAAEAVAVVFPGRQFTGDQLMFAMGESLAHLHDLWYAGRLERRVGVDGHTRFRAAGPRTETT